MADQLPLSSRIFAPAFAALALLIPTQAAPIAVSFSRGDLVKLTKGETLMFQGKDIFSAPKEEEFMVLKQDAVKGVLYLEFYKDDGSLVAVTAPTASFQAATTSPAVDLLKGAEAFREMRYDDAKKLLAKAGQDADTKPAATNLATKINAALVSATAARAAAGARPTFTAALTTLRDIAEQESAAGRLSMALAIDEGVDRLGASVFGAGQAGTPPTKLKREEVTGQVTAASRSLGRARQLLGVHKLYEGKKFVDEGLKAEPARPELKELDAKVQKDIAEADGHHKNAKSMLQHGPKGTVHALTAVELGLKLCVDHPKLRALKQEMQGAFEERTSPPVTAALMKMAGSGASQQALTEGHKIYTTRCTECHDLELLDSRSMQAWRDIVGGMSRRAKITPEQQAKIIDYIAVAQRTLDSGGGQ